MIESPVMNPIYERGIAMRRAIMREMLRRETAGLPAASAVTLAAALGVPRSTLQHHVGTMVRRGWVTTTAGRTAVVRLTNVGREVLATE